MKAAVALSEVVSEGVFFVSTERVAAVGRIGVDGLFAVAPKLEEIGA